MLSSTFHRYLIIGEEVCPTTNKFHLQGYTELHKKTTRSGLRKLFLPHSKTVHLAIARGTADQNIVYCSKEGHVHIIGAQVTAGTRTDLLAASAYLTTEGTTETDFRDNFFTVWAKYPNIFKRYKSLDLTESVGNFRRDQFSWTFDFPVNVKAQVTHSMIVWGEAGVGKTEYAKALLGPNYLLVRHMDKLGEFKPEFHSGILFDDMNFNHLHREAQIHLVDIDNESQIHIRYTMAMIPAHIKKIFTTNVKDGAIFDINDPAIRRRIKIHHCAVFK